MNISRKRYSIVVNVKTIHQTLNGVIVSKGESPSQNKSFLMCKGFQETPSFSYFISIFLRYRFISLVLKHSSILFNIKFKYFNLFEYYL